MSSKDDREKIKRLEEENEQMRTQQQAAERQRRLDEKAYKALADENEKMRATRDQPPTATSTAAAGGISAGGAAPTAGFSAGASLPSRSGSDGMGGGFGFGGDSPLLRRMTAATSNNRPPTFFVSHRVKFLGLESWASSWQMRVVSTPLRRTT